MGSNNTFDMAWKFYTLGYSVIPSGGGNNRKSPLVKWTPYQSKRPTDTELEHWDFKYRPKLWGMVTGPISNLFVIDSDSEESKAMMETAGFKPHVRTRKGSHYYFRWPSWDVTTKAAVLPGIDVRGKGGFVNFCGNNEKASYEVLIVPTADTLYSIEQLPIKLRKALKPKPKPLADRLIQQAVQRAKPGNRNETGLWLACQLRDNGITQAESVSTMRGYAAQVTNLSSEAYTEDEALASLQQAFTRPPRETWGIPRPAQAGVESYNLTDLGNAERLVQQYGEIIRYCYERKKWLIWTDKNWEWDTGANITALAKATVRNIYHEAGNESDEKRRKELAGHAKSSESDHRINAMIRLAESEPRIPIKATELDTKLWLFNCFNGTIDLKTGELLPHRKEDLLTILVPIRYHPDAPCQRWLSFLDQVTDGDTELQGYLQRAVGYSLTGETKSQVLFFLYGLGNNGKSTFMTTIRRLMGGYGERVSTDLFMVKHKNMGGPKEALANLQGKRLIAASELEDGRRLAVSLIKDMTGGETIKADRKYEHEFEFLPTHKIWLAGNHKPVITDTTLSIWRRMKLIPFTVTIPDNDIDPDLPSKLEAELSGILAWAIKGCLDWQHDGLREAHVVAKATATYRRDQDILADFIEDCCFVAPGASIPKADLKSRYRTWCNDNNVDPESARTFRERLIERGITDDKRRSVRYWRGLALKTAVSNETQNTPLGTAGDTGDKTDA